VQVLHSEVEYLFYQTTL